MSADVFPFPTPFEPGPFFVVGPNNYKQPKEQKYFATEEAADWLAERYGGSVIEQLEVAGGPYQVVDYGVTPAVEAEARYILFVGNGRTMQKNAGVYAELFLSYPNAFDYVDTLIKTEVQRGIQG